VAQHVLTLVAAEEGGLAEAHAPTGPVRWIAPGKALEVPLENAPPKGFVGDLRAKLDPERVDVFLAPAQGRVKKLLIADMDATIVEGETLDDLADLAGIGPQVATITARAMAGELDFAAALRERVGLLEGLEEAALDQTLAAMRLTRGARALVDSMRAAGARCILVSGGFTFFTQAIAARAGFHAHHGNVLEIQGGRLTGRVVDPILDKDAKLAFLHQYTKELGIGPEGVLALGDGANDIPMLRAAGLGIGFRPKPAVAAAVDNIIVHSGLDAALYAQGLTPLS
jgi:phosphoserine phosphatase